MCACVQERERRASGRCEPVGWAPSREEHEQARVQLALRLRKRALHVAAKPVANEPIHVKCLQAAEETVHDAAQHCEELLRPVGHDLAGQTRDARVEALHGARDAARPVALADPRRNLHVYVLHDADDVGGCRAATLLGGGRVSPRVVLCARLSAPRRLNNGIGVVIAAFDTLNLDDSLSNVWSYRKRCRRRIGVDAKATLAAAAVSGGFTQCAARGDTFIVFLHVAHARNCPSI